VFSFVLFSSGALFGTFAIKDILTGELLGAIGWFVPSLIFVILVLLDFEMYCAFDEAAYGSWRRRCQGVRQTSATLNALHLRT
jgi:hypothetical protein